MATRLHGSTAGPGGGVGIAGGPRCRRCAIEFETIMQLKRHRAKFCEYATEAEVREAAAFVQAHRRDRGGRGSPESAPSSPASSHRRHSRRTGGSAVTRAGSSPRGSPSEAGPAAAPSRSSKLAGLSDDELWRRKAELSARLTGRRGGDGASARADRADRTSAARGHGHLFPAVAGGEHTEASHLGRVPYGQGRNRPLEAGEGLVSGDRVRGHPAPHWGGDGSGASEGPASPLRQLLAERDALSRGGRALAHGYSYGHVESETVGALPPLTNGGGRPVSNYRTTALTYTAPGEEPPSAARIRQATARRPTASSTHSGRTTRHPAVVLGDVPTAEVESDPTHPDNPAAAKSELDMMRMLLSNAHLREQMLTFFGGMPGGGASGGSGMPPPADSIAALVGPGAAMGDPSTVNSHPPHAPVLAVLDRNSAAAGLPDGSVFPDYRPEIGFKLLWDRATGLFQQSQTLLLATAVGEYDSQLADHPMVETELPVSLVSEGRQTRTITLEQCRPFRSVDLPPRPTLYAIIELYSMPPEAERHMRASELLGTACFFPFEDDGSLRAGCWRLQMLGDIGGCIEFRVMDGRASLDAQRAFCPEAAYRPDTMSSRLQGWQSRLQMQHEKRGRNSDRDGGGGRRTPREHDGHARHDGDIVLKVTEKPTSARKGSAKRKADGAPEPGSIAAIAAAKDAAIAAAAAAPPPPELVKKDASFFVHLVEARLPGGPMEIRIKTTLRKEGSSKTRGLPKWLSGTAARQKENNEYKINDCGHLADVEVYTNSYLTIEVLDATGSAADQMAKAARGKQKGNSKYANATSLLKQLNANDAFIGRGKLALYDHGSKEIRKGAHTLSLRHVNADGSVGSEIKKASLLVEIHEGKEAPGALNNVFCPAAAWVAGPTTRPPVVPYLQGKGVDVYIDGARTLPFSTTVTRVIATVHAGDKFENMPDVSLDAVVDPDTNDVLSPTFGARFEMRDSIPLDAILVVRLYTVDRYSQELTYLGFSAVNLFNWIDEKGNANEVTPKAADAAKHADVVARPPSVAKQKSLPDLPGVGEAEDADGGPTDGQAAATGPPGSRGDGEANAASPGGTAASSKKGSKPGTTMSTKSGPSTKSGNKSKPLTAAKQAADDLDPIAKDTGAGDAADEEDHEETAPVPCFTVNSGGHQLRLYMHYPATAKDVMRVVRQDEAESKATRGLQLSCASLTVRLRVPPTRDGVPLSTDTVPITEWEETGLVEPMPSYVERAYNTARCEPQQHELLMFRSLVYRASRRLTDAIGMVDPVSGAVFFGGFSHFLLSSSVEPPAMGRGPNSDTNSCRSAQRHVPARPFARARVYGLCPAAPAETKPSELVKTRFALEGWLKTQLRTHEDPGPAVPKISRAHVVMYDKKYGMAISVDTAFNLPNDNLLCYPTILVISPGEKPGDDPMVEHAFWYRLSWHLENNTVQNPWWDDGMQPFMATPLRDNSLAIVMLWKTKSGGSPSMIGWGALPVAVNGSFVNFGAFQIPLFKGAMTKELASALVTVVSDDERLGSKKKRSSMVPGAAMTGDAVMPAHQRLLEVTAANRIKPLPGASIAMRVCDARRHSELSPIPPKLDTIFMPKEKTGAVHKRYRTSKAKSKKAEQVLGKRERRVHDKWTRMVMAVCAESVFKLGRGNIEM